MRRYALGMAYDREEVWKRQFGADVTEDKDACGTEVHYNATGNSDYAWEVDHIFPKEWLERLEVPEVIIDDPINLRVLQHSNNEAKGNDYPRYCDGNGKQWRINIQRQEKLANFYQPWIKAFIIRWNGSQSHTTKDKEICAFLKKAGLIEEQ